MPVAAQSPCQSHHIQEADAGEAVPSTPTCTCQWVQYSGNSSACTINLLLEANNLTKARSSQCRPSMASTREGKCTQLRANRQQHQQKIEPGVVAPRAHAHQLLRQRTEHQLDHINSQQPCHSIIAPLPALRSPKPEPPVLAVQTDPAPRFQFQPKTEPRNCHHLSSRLH